jgi:FkbM family methyltransferase
MRRTSLIYRPLVNRAVRSLLRPLTPVIPERWQLPVVGAVTVRLPGGGTVRLEGNPTSYVTKRLYWHGAAGYEPELMALFLRLVRRSKVFFDVGANIGYYAAAALAVNPSVRVVAFEPLPAAFRYLERNLRPDGASRARAENLAVSDASGTDTFVAPHNPKFAFVEDPLTSVGSLGHGAGMAGERIQVRVDTLDRYVERSGLVPDLLKLDTEATEHRVIAGAAGLFASARPLVLCEVLPGRVEAQIQTALAPYDYAWYHVTAGGLIPVRGLGHTGDHGNDFLFAPRECAAELG